MVNWAKEEGHFFIDNSKKNDDEFCGWAQRHMRFIIDKFT